MKKQDEQDKLKDEAYALNIVKEAEGSFDGVWTDTREDTLFESGSQWEETEKNNREKSKLPVLTTNICRTQINRVCNPYLKYPFTIEVQEDGLKEIVNNVEKQEGAVKKYYSAHKSQTSTGFGYLCCKIGYLNDYSEELKLEIETLKPWECALDLENDWPKWGVIKRKVPIATAIQMGYESPDNRDENNYFEEVETYIAYYLKQSQVRRVFSQNQYQDFGIDDEIEFEYSSERAITQSILCEKVIIKNQVISTKEYNTDVVPIVVALGEETLKERDSHTGGQQYDTYTGMIYRMRDSQIQTNRMNSILQEVMEMLPDTPWIASAEQIKNHKKYWERKPGIRHNVKIYNGISSSTGERLPPPTQAPVQQNIGLALQVKQNATEDLSRTSSVTDQMRGEGETAGVESGIALAQKQLQGEVATINYTYEMKECLRRFGRVILKMYGVISGEVVQVGQEQVPIEIYNKAVDNVEIDVISGPDEQEKSIRNQALMSELANQNEGLTLFFQIQKVKESDMKDKDKIAKILEAQLPPELQDPENNEGISPQTQQVINAAQQANQVLLQQLENMTAIAQQLQTQLIDNEKDREVDLAEAQIKANTELAKTQANNESSERQTAMKEAGANQRKEADIIADTQKQNKEIVTKVMENEQSMQVETDQMIPSAPKRIIT